MQQAKLLFPRPLTVLRDLGPIGESGASRARIVHVSDGEEYVVKHPTLMQDPASHPYLCANEYIGAKVAEWLGLPVLPYRVVELNGLVYFASLRVEKQSLAPAFTEDVYQRAIDQSIIYNILALDTWLLNVDRHDRNVLCRRLNNENPPTYSLLLNDHDRVLSEPGRLPADEFAVAGIPFHRLVRTHVIKHYVTNGSLLEGAVSDIWGIPEEAIYHLMTELPASWIRTETDRTLLADFVIKRRRLVRDILWNNRAFFPNLKWEGVS